MRSDDLRSASFQRALLRSEQLRIFGLLAMLSVGFLLMAVRALLTDDPVEIGLASEEMAILGAMVAFELLSLRAVRRAIRSGAERLPPHWLLAPVVETLLPTLSLLVIAQIPATGPVRALAGPAVVLYYILITLSILRLNPLVPMLTGLLAAAGYASVMFLVLTGVLSQDQHAGLALGMSVTQGVLILAAGGVAAAVAARLRENVAAALREEAARREVERYRGELLLAQEIQQGLLPGSPPAIDGFEVAGWNRPADETGGDSFDWVSLPSGDWVVTIADATGHGIAAALMMAACRAYMRASFAASCDLSQALETTSARLLEDLPPEKFVTLAAAQVTPGSTALRVLSAGHAPMLFYRAAEGSVTELGSHGIPLGTLPGFSYPAAEVLTLAPGDMLIFLTDGFWESENTAGEEFGRERLAAALAAAAGSSAAEVIVQLSAAVDDFADRARQSDDLTAVVIRKL